MVLSITKNKKLSPYEAYLQQRMNSIAASLQFFTLLLGVHTALLLVIIYHLVK